MLSFQFVIPLICAVYGNVDITVHKSSSISRTMFAAHVSEMHCNRDEGFEREFMVRRNCVPDIMLPDHDRF